MSTQRMVAVWCPDWPVTAVRAGGEIPVDAPMAVFTANRVVACSHSARRYGVVRGQRRREAQARCPELVVATRDEQAEARLFEPVVRVIEQIAPGVEVTRPGLAAVGARGPRRYFGGEEKVVHALARQINDALDTALDDALDTTAHSFRAHNAVARTLAADVLVGVADGLFAAEQAARRGMIVAAGGSGDFLAGLPISTLGSPDLVDLLRRLGIRTLGAFAALPAGDVLARFGPLGAWAHRQAGGRDERPIAGRAPVTEFTVHCEFDPPVERVDTVAFSVRTMAERFVQDLAGHGLACTCFELATVTANGEEAVRRWRQSGVLTAVDVVDRIRWQLEGWLSGHNGGRTHGVRPGDPAPAMPTAGVVLVRLTPVETVPTGAHQQPLWGGSGVADERAHRALARVQSLLGHGEVGRPVVQGGRDPLQRTGLTVWGDDRDNTTIGDAAAPWPGRLPAPAPSVLLDPPRAVQVLDENGRPVQVTDRGAVPMPPATLLFPDPVTITAWAGPWPVDEQWWRAPSGGPDAALGQRRSRFQLVDVRGRAYLAVHRQRPDSGTAWVIEGIYD